MAHERLVSAAQYFFVGMIIGASLIGKEIKFKKQLMGASLLPILILAAYHTRGDAQQKAINALMTAAGMFAGHMGARAALGFRPPEVSSKAPGFNR